MLNINLKKGLIRLFLMISCYAIFLVSCGQSTNNSTTDAVEEPEGSGTIERPNILWIVAEDMSEYLPSFRDSTIVTPNLSRLAAEGICYDNFFAPHPVCAPARAAIITGRYANSIGASHMRTGPWFGGRPSTEALQNYQNNAMPKNITAYEAVPPPEVKMFTEYLRKAGYYCSNNSKEDYQFIKTPTAWDDSSSKAHWRNRASNQPFFSIFNIGITHESQIWRKQKDSLWVEADLEVPVPPYLPDTDIAKNDIRRMYSNVKEMDARVGEILKELEADGLLENTIIFWYTDHGGPLPRQKRLLYDSGIKVPMIIRFPNSIATKDRDSSMISFIDLAPTLLSIAHIKPPAYMQGNAFLGNYQPSQKPTYVFGAADRFDASSDKIRSVRDKQFKYIKYYNTNKPMYLEVSYRNQMPIMQELLRLRDQGDLSENQALWFRKNKPEEELFDILNDPHEINNLANNPAYQSKLVELRQACEKWVTDINDTGLLPEEELVSIMVPNGVQPKTANVRALNTNGALKLESDTEGASIGYKIINDSMNTNELPWMLYEKPIPLNSGQKLQTIAHRIGYLPSDIGLHNQ
ncbi:sulfatase family protein [Lutimonas sp.]|uniref:sulfatase family protein n=1 Tax=Lutimonas sp. TaxID=1872403 RepID=UPI003D9B35C4